jgi:hypothetical protein
MESQPRENLPAEACTEMFLETPDEADTHTVFSRHHWPWPYNMPSDQVEISMARDTPLPIPSFEEESLLLVSNGDDSSDESEALSASSSRARSTTPDTEVSSPPSSPLLEAIKPKSSWAEDFLDFSEDLQELFHKNQVVKERSDYGHGRLTSDDDAAETAEGLRAQIDDATGDEEALDTLLSEEEDDIRDLFIDGDKAQSSEYLQTGFTAGDEAVMPRVDDSTTSSTSESARKDEHMQNASSTSGDTASVNASAQNTGFTSTDPTSSKMDDVAPTFAVASPSPFQFAMGEPQGPQLKFGGWDAWASGNIIASVPQFGNTSSGQGTAMTGIQATPTFAATPQKLALPVTQQSLPSSSASFLSLLTLPSSGVTVPQAATAPQAAPPTPTAPRVALVVPAETQSSPPALEVDMADAGDDKASPAVAQHPDQSRMEDVQSVSPQRTTSTPDSASPLVPFAHLFERHHPRQPLAIAGCDTVTTLSNRHPIFQKLSKLGPSFHTELKQGQDEGLGRLAVDLPDLHDMVNKDICKATVSKRLIDLLLVHFNNGRVTLKELRKFRHFVLEARSPSPAPRAENWNTPFVNLLRAPEPDSAKADHTLLNLDATQKDVGNLELDIEAQNVSGRLLNIYKQFINRPWLRNFRKMFEMPWNNAESMTKICRFIVKHPKWGQGNHARAMGKLEEISPDKVTEAAFLFWICCKCLHTEGLEIQGRPGTYQAERKKMLRQLWERIAGSNFEVIIKSYAAKCLSWHEMKDLVQKEEYEIVRPGFVTKARYLEEMARKLAHWSEPRNLIRHLDPESLFLSASTPAPSLLKIVSRPQDDEPETSRNTRMRLAEDNGPEDNRPVQGHDQQPDHRRRRAGGK